MHKDELEVMKAALRDLEQFARVEETVDTRQRLRDVITRSEPMGVIMSQLSIGCSRRI